MPFRVGFMVEKMTLERILSPSPLILSSVRIILPQFFALSFMCHRRHIILAGVRVIDRIKRYYNVMCQAAHILILFLSLCLAYLRSVLVLSNIKSQIIFR